MMHMGVVTEVVGLAPHPIELALHMELDQVDMVVGMVEMNLGVMEDMVQVPWALIGVTSLMDILAVMVAASIEVTIWAVVMVGPVMVMGLMEELELEVDMEVVMILALVVVAMVAAVVVPCMVEVVAREEVSVGQQEMDATIRIQGSIVIGLKCQVLKLGVWARCTCATLMYFICWDKDK